MSNLKLLWSIFLKTFKLMEKIYLESGPKLQNYYTYYNFLKDKYLDPNKNLVYITYIILISLITLNYVYKLLFYLIECIYYFLKDVDLVTIMYIILLILYVYFVYSVS